MGSRWIILFGWILSGSALALAEDIPPRDLTAVERAAIDSLFAARRTGTASQEELKDAERLLSSAISEGNPQLRERVLKRIYQQPNSQTAIDFFIKHFEVDSEVVAFAWEGLARQNGSAAALQGAWGAVFSRSRIQPKALGTLAENGKALLRSFTADATRHPGRALEPLSRQIELVRSAFMNPIVEKWPSSQLVPYTDWLKPLYGPAFDNPLPAGIPAQDIQTLRARAAVPLAMGQPGALWDVAPYVIPNLKTPSLTEFDRLCLENLSHPVFSSSLDRVARSSWNDAMRLARSTTYGNTLKALAPLFLAGLARHNDKTFLELVGRYLHAPPENLRDILQLHRRTHAFPYTDETVAALAQFLEKSDPQPALEILRYFEDYADGAVSFALQSDLVRAIAQRGLKGSGDLQNAATRFLSRTSSRRDLAAKALLQALRDPNLVSVEAELEYYRFLRKNLLVLKETESVLLASIRSRRTHAPEDVLSQLGPFSQEFLGELRELSQAKKNTPLRAKARRALVLAQAEPDFRTQELLKGWLASKNTQEVKSAMDALTAAAARSDQRWPPGFLDALAEILEDPKWPGDRRQAISFFSDEKARSPAAQSLLFEWATRERPLSEELRTYFRGLGPWEGPSLSRIEAALQDPRRASNAIRFLRLFPPERASARYVEVLASAFFLHAKIPEEERLDGLADLLRPHRLEEPVARASREAIRSKEPKLRRRAIVLGLPDGLEAEWVKAYRTERNPVNRIYAIRALSDSQLAHPDIQFLLLDSIRVEAHDNVRQVTAYAIQKITKLDPTEMTDALRLVYGKPFYPGTVEAIAPLVLRSIPQRPSSFFRDAPTARPSPDELAAYNLPQLRQATGEALIEWATWNPDALPHLQANLHRISDDGRVHAQRVLEDGYRAQPGLRPTALAPVGRPGGSCMQAETEALIRQAGPPLRQP